MADNKELRRCSPTVHEGSCFTAPWRNSTDYDHEGIQEHVPFTELEWILTPCTANSICR